MGEVCVRTFWIFPIPFSLGKRQKGKTTFTTKEQKRPVRTETAVSRRAPPCLGISGNPNKKIVGSNIPSPKYGKCGQLRFFPFRWEPKCIRIISSAVSRCPPAGKNINVNVMCLWSPHLWFGLIKIGGGGHGIAAVSWWWHRVLFLSRKETQIWETFASHLDKCVWFFSFFNLWD